MNKSILEQYEDACALIRETEQDIERLRRRRETIHTSSVKGSLQDFPYTEAHFKISGMAYTYNNDKRLREEIKLLEEQKAKAEEIKLQVERWMLGIPLRMQRIIRYKYFEGKSWEKVARLMGRKTTGESIKKEYQRFMKKIKFVPIVPECPEKRVYSIKCRKWEGAIEHFTTP